MDFEKPSEQQRRLSLQKGLSLLVGMLMAIYSPLNVFYLKAPIIGSFEALIGIFAFYCLWRAIIGKAKKHQYYILVACTTLLIYSLAYTADMRAMPILWGLSLPIIYYIMFGARQGFIFTLLILLPSLFIIFHHSPDVHFIPYRAMANYGLAHLFIWSLCHLYERQHDKDRDKLKTMALYDALTGIYNRHAFENYFTQLGNKPTQCHMLLIDIDFFKKVNDQYGHGIGDFVLMETALYLRKCANSDDIYRLGGEEFVILLENHSDQLALEHAEDIRQAIEKHAFHNQDTQFKITVSIGIAKRMLGQSTRDFLLCADKKLYAAKNKGRNCVCI